MTVAASAVVHPNVHLAEAVHVGDFCVLGEPARGRAIGDDQVLVGAGSVIRSHTVVYAGARLGARFQCGHWVLIRENTTVGDDCSIGTGSVVEFSVTVEDGVRLHSQCFVPEHSVLEAGCWLGPRVVVTNSRFPAGPRSKQSLEGVRICAGARVGANATLLPGVVIGAGALVGAGAVITRDVAPDSIVVGNPARPTGRVSELRDATGYIYGEVTP